MRRTPLQTSILSVIGVAGVIGIALVAPGIFAVAGIAGGTIQGAKKKFEKLNPSRKQYIGRVIKRLEKQGFVVIKNTSHGDTISLSKKGELFLRTVTAHGKETRRWDKKWRILTFDVYEHNRSRRDQLRRHIREYGFIQLQQSVWVYPHDCTDFVALLKTELSFGKNVRYIIAEEIEEDAALRKYFKLK